LQYIVQFCKLFKDEATMWQLRPIWYSYWG
jgi:hypothetical protein